MSNTKVLQALKEMPGWEFHETFITKSFECENFKGALGFVNAIGELAERKDHHPDILLHNWNRVTITLTTHSLGGITQKDLDIAKGIDSIQ